MAGPERRTRTQDGHELTFQVNYLAPYLLTTKLLPRLASAGGRVVNLSSVMHRGGNINWKNPVVGTGTCRCRPTHNQSSSSRCTQRRWPRLAVFRSPRSASISACSRPGSCPIYGRVGRPAEEAAQILAALSSPTHPVVDGGYYDGLSLAPSATLVDNARARSCLAKLSGQLVGSGLD